jgi:hypothetical protein
LLNFYQIDYILTDITLNKYNLNNYKIDKIYKFKEFSLYLYKKKSLKNSTEVKKINIINNYNEYNKNIPNFDNQIYILKEDFSKIKGLKNLCTTEIIHNNNEIFFKIRKLNSEKCIAIFPIPFSHNNYFIKKIENTNQKKIECQTFRVQYYFHACIINENNTSYVLKKKNLLSFPFGSFRDFIDLKKIDWKNNNQKSNLK